MSERVRVGMNEGDKSETHIHTHQQAFVVVTNKFAIHRHLVDTAYEHFTNQLLRLRLGRLQLPQEQPMKREQSLTVMYM